SCPPPPLPGYGTVYLPTHVLRNVNVYKNVAGHEPGTDLGPLTSPQAKKRVCNLIESGVKEGASLVLDGRDVNVKGYENGNFVGPTIITGVKVCTKTDFLVLVIYSSMTTPIHLFYALSPIFCVRENSPTSSLIFQHL
ncbi:MAG: aldehyde dehydrogenase family protein, partial [Gammaproteobacteria bacterium]|nr:aldehyde dehydrogenase family protein [Gammaproteobacteria bacterium]